MSDAEVVAWARGACAVLPHRVRGPLLDDLAELCQAVCVAGGTRQLLARIFTEAPTRRCGFHLDTVPPQAPVVGALRVYNGATTEYVEPADVRDMPAFYAHLSRRERLSHRTADDPHAVATLCGMDDAPEFLRPDAAVRRVPDGVAVFFRHLDITRHWSAHPVAAAWIHRSPMAGTRRLVVNLSPVERATRPPRPERAARG
ncbi:hypothetical protein FXF52_28200 [Micromonospora sp. MP36]|nr:hypothetical protein FXF52_28200 [Micromonospora sp. MP36]